MDMEEENSNTGGIAQIEMARLVSRVGKVAMLSR
jgi:hypothetical protein